MLVAFWLLACLVVVAATVVSYFNPNAAAAIGAGGTVLALAAGAGAWVVRRQKR
ncbi:hypothetical protein [Dactylosporangium maewongense]